MRKHWEREILVEEGPTFFESPAGQIFILGGAIFMGYAIRAATHK